MQPANIATEAILPLVLLDQPKSMNHLEIQRSLERALFEVEGELVRAQSTIGQQSVNLDRAQVAGLGAAFGVARRLRPDPMKEGLDPGGEFVGIDVGILAAINAEELSAQKAAVLPIGGAAAVGHTTYVGHSAHRGGR